MNKQPTNLVPIRQNIELFAAQVKHVHTFDKSVSLLVECYGIYDKEDMAKLAAGSNNGVKLQQFKAVMVNLDLAFDTRTTDDPDTNLCDRIAEGDRIMVPAEDITIKAREPKQKGHYARKREPIHKFQGVNKTRIAILNKQKGMVKSGKVEFTKTTESKAMAALQGSAEGGSVLSAIGSFVKSLIR